MDYTIIQLLDIMKTLVATLFMEEYINYIKGQAFAMKSNLIQKYNTYNENEKEKNKD